MNTLKMYYEEYLENMNLTREEYTWNDFLKDVDEEERCYYYLRGENNG